MSENHDWSDLCPDLLRSIFKILNNKDFHRTRTVCSNWNVVSATCKRTLYPWRILLGKNSSLLYDPEDDDKIREFEHPELDLSEYSKTKTYCIAVSSNWLLVADLRINFNLLNVFTKVKIHLPPLELSFIGIEHDDDDLEEWEYYIDRGDLVSGLAVVWINERTRDYVVAWAYKRNLLFTFKKGDEAWRRNIRGTKCSDMAFKDNKLYVFTLEHYIKILDFSGDSPR
ncbi:PREDICTED: putative F-box protein At2g33200 [Camelina sativa]|uniref:F-box protein At2g33200 n=1 Tax=Camelina sativa TaxID=90675 RepID=A0ABM0T021_CAMSA|nr:PREDICTED: putative F-box protein At2g33200 [Camelina sativa]